jgi:hypothetical protein
MGWVFSWCTIFLTTGDRASVQHLSGDGVVNRLGEVSAVPIQVAQALAGTSSATVQLVTSDGGCFEAELGTVKRAEQFSFVAKGP